MEEWRPVSGWEGFYEVSDLGRVRSLDRTAVIRNPFGVLAPRLYKGRVLGSHVSKSGYHIVTLARPGFKPICRNVHELVLTTFVGPPGPGMECCHGPAGPTVNALSNLRWDTRSANSCDRRRDGTVPDSRGIKNCNAKLTALDVSWIKVNRCVLSRRAMGRCLGISHGRVSAVLRGLSYTNV